jgi:hypothetical protein
MSQFKKMHQHLEVEIDGKTRSCAFDIVALDGAFKVTMQRLKIDDPDGTMGLKRPNQRETVSIQLEGYEEPQTFSIKGEAFNYILEKTQSFLKQKFAEL